MSVGLKDKGKPFLTISHQRSGSLFLVQCINSHPDIHCVWEKRKNFDDDMLEWMVRFPPCIGFNAKYNQFDRQSYPHDPLKDFDQGLLRSGLRTIHLIRKDLMRVALSDVINIRKERYKTPTHVWEPTEIPRVEIDVEDLSTRVRFIHEKILRWRDVLGPDCLTVFYEDLTNNQDSSSLPADQAKRICDFLDIPHRTLSATTRKVHGSSPSDYVSNWEEIKGLHGDLCDEIAALRLS